jgi:hypothetical protein
MGVLDGLLGGALGAVGGLVTNAINVGQQNKAWAREDNAVQRRAADMQAAGFNPVLAAGAPAQSSPAVRLDNVAEGAMQGAQSATDISRTQAQEELINQQKSNEYTHQKILSANAEEADASARLKTLEADRAENLAGIQYGDSQGKATRLYSAASDTILKTMQNEASSNNLKSVTEKEHQAFMNKYQPQYDELERKAKNEKWTQEQLVTATRDLTKQIMEKSLKWMDIEKGTGVASQAVGTLLKLFAQ